MSTLEGDGTVKVYTSSPSWVEQAVARSTAASMISVVTGTPGVRGSAVPQVSLVALGTAGTICTSSATVVPCVVVTYTGYAVMLLGSPTARARALATSPPVLEGKLVPHASSVDGSPHCPAIA